MCSDQWMQPFTSTVFLLGVLFGSFLSGQVSDRYCTNHTLFVHHGITEGDVHKEQNRLISGARGGQHGVKSQFSSRILILSHRPEFFPSERRNLRRPHVIRSRTQDKRRPVYTCLKLFLFIFLFCELCGECFQNPPGEITVFG